MTMVPRWLPRVAVAALVMAGVALAVEVGDRLGIIPPAHPTVVLQTVYASPSPTPTGWPWP